MGPLPPPKPPRSAPVSSPRHFMECEALGHCRPCTVPVTSHVSRGVLRHERRILPSNSRLYPVRKHCTHPPQHVCQCALIRSTHIRSETRNTRAQYVLDSSRSTLERFLPLSPSTSRNGIPILLGSHFPTHRSNRVRADARAKHQMTNTRTVKRDPR